MTVRILSGMTPCPHRAPWCPTQHAAWMIRNGYSVTEEKRALGLWVSRAIQGRDPMTGAELESTTSRVRSAAG